MKTMGMRGGRYMAVLLLGAGLLVLLCGCMGQWFSQEQPATLVIGKLTRAGNAGEVLVSVADMPDDGLASIAIDNLGITYTDLDPTTIEAKGLNGFTVLAQDFTTTAGKGRLVAVNPTAGSKSGTILKVTFDIVGPNPTFTIDPADQAKVTLGSALDTLISGWDLSSGQADYYAK